MNYKKISLIAFSAGALAATVLLIGQVAGASSTISTNISTGGTLTVTGASTLTGEVQASSTALFGGTSTFYGNVVYDKAATTTVTYNQAGINYDSDTFVIDPNANKVGMATSAPYAPASLSIGTITGLDTGTSLVTGGRVGIRGKVGINDVNNFLLM